MLNYKKNNNLKKINQISRYMKLYIMKLGAFGC